MDNIASKIERIYSAKQAIRSAMETYGVSVSSSVTIDQYPGYIRSVYEAGQVDGGGQAGGGAIVLSGNVSMSVGFGATVGNVNCMSSVNVAMPMLTINGGTVTSLAVSQGGFVTVSAGSSANMNTGIYEYIGGTVSSATVFSAGTLLVSSRGVVSSVSVSSGGLVSCCAGCDVEALDIGVGASAIYYDSTQWQQSQITSDIDDGTTRIILVGNPTLQVNIDGAEESVSVDGVSGYYSGCNGTYLKENASTYRQSGGSCVISGENNVYGTIWNLYLVGATIASCQDAIDGTWTGYASPTVSVVSGNGGQWKVSGLDATWRNTGDVASGWYRNDTVPTVVTVTFKDVTGYVKPADTNVNLYNKRVVLNVSYSTGGEGGETSSSQGDLACIVVYDQHANLDDYLFLDSGNENDETGVWVGSKYRLKHFTYEEAGMWGLFDKNVSLFIYSRAHVAAYSSTTGVNPTIWRSARFTGVNDDIVFLLHYSSGQ